jgi:parvulin-like peptidyl-prolyl isomerase
MFLTKEQQQILKDASSKLSTDQFDLLTREESDVYIAKLDVAIRNVQGLNPNAFIFTYKKNKQVDSKPECEQRKFYDAPTTTVCYKSAEKYRVRYPRAHNISTGVR